MIQASRAVGAKEGREECLEAIYRIDREARAITWEALKGNPDLSRIDISATLLDLVAQGDVEIKDGVIELKDSGRVIGRRIYRRHELVERFLRVVGLRRQNAHEEACRLEHITTLPTERTRGVSERQEFSLICNLLDRGAVPLTRAVPGVSYRLGMVYGGRGARRKLEEMGVCPGVEITLFGRQHGGPVEIAVRGSRLALGRGVASKVLVVSPDGPMPVWHRHGGHHGHRGRHRMWPREKGRLA